MSESFPRICDICGKAKLDTDYYEFGTGIKSCLECLEKRRQEVQKSSLDKPDEACYDEHGDLKE